MSNYFRRLAISTLVAAIVLPVPVYAGLSDFLKGLGKNIQAPSLSQDKISQGLKEALRIGAKNAVGTVSKTNGYLGNPVIRIPLPQSLRKAEKIARLAGYGDPIDAFFRIPKTIGGLHPSITE